MKTRPVVILVTFLYIFYSCSKTHESSDNIHKLKIIHSSGTIVPSLDTIKDPFNVILEDEIVVRDLKTPNTKICEKQSRQAGTPIVRTISSLVQFVPGSDTIDLPTRWSFKDSSFIANAPEIIIAKEAYTKELNPYNFSIYKKQQGMKHTYVNSMYEDRIGNVWFGTLGGGVTKYDGRNFTFYTTNEGLSNNSILSILEDKNGNFWFGTDGGGVTKYNGKQFTHFLEGSNKSVYDIIEDANGNIWMGRSDGLVKFDGEKYTHYTTQQGLISNTVYSLFADKNGNIWIGTASGIAKYDGLTFTHITEKDGLGNNTVKSITDDNNGNIWFGTMGGGATKFDGKSLTTYNEKTGISNNSVRVIRSDKKGNVWFGTWDGITKFDGNNFSVYKETGGLSNNTVMSILNDRYGNLWFGTLGGGVNKYYGNTFTHLTVEDGLLNNDVRFIYEDSKKNIWMGSWGGVTKYDGISFTNYTVKEGLSNNAVWSILEDRKGNMWFGTLGGGVNKFDGKRFTSISKEGLNNSILSMTEDKHGNLWFGTWGGGLYKYDGNVVESALEGKTNLSFDYSKLKKVDGHFVKTITKFGKNNGVGSDVINSVVADKEGNIWIGTDGAGLVKFDGKKFIRFSKSEGLASNAVTGVYIDKDDNVWFSGENQGICRYNKKVGFIYLTEREGLCSNTTSNTLEDENGNFWFATRYGLSMITKNKLEEIIRKTTQKGIIESDIYFRNYTYEDGFLGLGCNGNALMKNSNGDLWIGANDRLTIYNHSAQNLDTIIPVVKLTDVLLFHEKIDWDKLSVNRDSVLTLGNGVRVQGLRFDTTRYWYNLPEQLSLAYNNNFLTFNFIGITHNQPKKVRYQYKLEGIDDTWSAINSQPEAHYGNLPPGSYVFKLKAMNGAGVWSDECRYSFTIRPPWWETWWFRTGLILTVIILIWYYIKWREKTLLMRQSELEKSVDERTEEVVAEKKIVEFQKNLIEVKHKEITDSINYAERIQRSLLASTDLLVENLNDYFIYFQPKDIVSGDFYWVNKLRTGKLALLTADSTGHGVPGAIMSFLNISCIEKAVEAEKLVEPDEILNYTRIKIIDTLKKDGSAEGGKDGMDCSLICFDFANNKFNYAASNNPVWVVRNNELIELLYDKMPVGKHDRDSTPFTKHEFATQKGDMIYTLTDGMPDQFGGPKGKKFMYKQLKELLISISSEPMELQKQKISYALINWKGNMEQVDDITLIGVRV